VGSSNGNIGLLALSSVEEGGDALVFALMEKAAVLQTLAKKRAQSAKRPTKIFIAILRGPIAL